MRKVFLDRTVFEARNMEKDGNIDNNYWHNKTVEEKLQAAAIVTAAAFGEPDFLKKKVDRTIYTSRKHKQ
ncbi:MAG TPA: hypothetical protein PLW32_01725 [Chitinophagaceae bacterium]|jgi:hypothetical protein|nr:hypothetical protein [Chitinophagaceae bacterium]MBP9739134.1 hypothetical protein [Chitinophagaceae bacterium]HPH22574.1 hypothetical protein [Chitinophagaceae bacterium]